MESQKMRDTLIARTISVIATEGLDRTTTKAIVTGTGINEAYIYRLFEDKVDLLCKAFDSLDAELVEKTLEFFPVMQTPDMEKETRCRMYFLSVWNFMLGNKEKCLAFVRYYYSQYFARNSYEAHRERYKPLVERFSVAFTDEADVWMILNHILNVMLDFAVKVHNDQMKKEDDYVEHVFRVIYASVKQYFRNSD